MNLRTLARAAALGISVAVLASAVADARPFRFFDPSAGGFVTYDTDRFSNRERKPDPKFARQTVDYETTEAPGTIIIDSTDKFLYYVLPNQTAIRYGVGVGREGFGWSGIVRVGAMQEWPVWTPPPEMIERRPDVAKYATGMPGGEDNPLGARAMYLFDGGRDTMYRIHGTNEPWSIGQNVSSGCIRMLNDDVSDLYSRVTVGTKVIVM